MREVDVSIATLAWALAALDLTRKEVSKAASEWDEELRTLNCLELLVVVERDAGKERSDRLRYIMIEIDIMEMGYLDKPANYTHNGSSCCT